MLQGGEPDERRLDLGRRPEGPRADVEQPRHGAARLQHHGQPAVGLPPRAGGHPVHDLLLQHEVHIADAADLVEQVEQQRRGDVVGQVADDAQPLARRREGTEVEAQRVRAVHVQLAEADAAILQRSDEVAVELDRVEPARRAQEVERDGAFARPDLHEAVRRPRRHGGDDAPDHLRVVEEVLAEALAWLVGHGGWVWRGGKAQRPSAATPAFFAA